MLRAFADTARRIPRHGVRCSMASSHSLLFTYIMLRILAFEFIFTLNAMKSAGLKLHVATGSAAEFH